MNQAIIASVPMAPMQMPVVRRRRVKVTEPEIKLPPRGSRGPVHISELLNPILEISKHPDRNRLLAEFFNQWTSQENNSVLTLNYKVIISMINYILFYSITNTIYIRSNYNIMKPIAIHMLLNALSLIISL